MAVRLAAATEERFAAARTEMAKNPNRRAPTKAELLKLLDDTLQLVDDERALRLDTIKALEMRHVVDILEEAEPLCSGICDAATLCLTRAGFKGIMGHWDWLLPLLGGLGIGSLLKSIIDHFQSRRAVLNDRFYQEKREAYLGLLDALHKAALKHSDETAKNYALWEARCDLFGSEDVSKYAKEIVETNDGPREARASAFRSLIAAMKLDLQR